MISDSRTDRHPDAKFLDAMWDELWEELRHFATGRPSGAAIIARHRPLIEAVVAASTRADIARAIEALEVIGDYGEGVPLNAVLEIVEGE